MTVDGGAARLFGLGFSDVLRRTQSGEFALTSSSLCGATTHEGAIGPNDTHLNEFEEVLAEVVGARHVSSLAGPRNGLQSTMVDD